MKRNFEALQQELDKLAEEIRTKVTDAKVSASLVKHVESIKKQHAKKRKQGQEKGSMNSGLQKPSKVSTEIAKFASWPKDELHSRVDVTKVICKYIKDHDLQNPENRREIRLDSKLKKLLKYDKPIITYPHIQKYIGVHFIKEEKKEEKKVAV